MVTPANSLAWPSANYSSISAVVPFTYRDGVTYLVKLEDIAQTLNISISTLNELIGVEHNNTVRQDAAYQQLISDFNARLNALDPAQVSQLLAAQQGTITGLGNRVTAIEGANYGGQIANAITSANAHSDAADTATLNAARSYADTKKGESAAYTDASLVSAKAYADTKKTEATTYTDTKITDLATVYEPRASVNSHVDDRVIANLNSSTPMRGAFDNRYSQISATAFPRQGRAGGVWYLSTYCTAQQIAGTVSVSPVINTILAEIATSNQGKSWGGQPQYGGTIVIDGKFLVDQAFTPPPGLTLMGTGAFNSGFILNGDDFMRISDGQWSGQCLFMNFGIDISSTGKSFLRMTGTDGNNESILTNSTFMGLRIRTLSTSAPAAVNLTGYSEYHANHWLNNVIDRPTASTVGAFYFAPNAGNVCNSNSIKGLWVHGHNSVGNYAIYLGATAAGYQHNWTLEDICGEQNCAGLVYLRGINGIQIRNCVDWDAAVNYTNSVIRVGASSAGTASCNVEVSTSGRPIIDGRASMEVWVENGTLNSAIRGCGSINGAATTVGGDLTSVDGLKKPYKYITANYTVGGREECILINGTGVTVTLPDPMATAFNRQIQIVNLGASAATLNTTNGRLVAGTTSYSLAAGAAISLMTDGQLVSGSGAAMRWLKFS